MSKSSMPLPIAFFIVLLTIVGNLVGYIFSMWLVGSLLTSGTKSYKGQCGTKFKVEKYYLDGDFFCN